jgi:hypothetical protein
MSNNLNPKTDPEKPVVYQIRLQGELDSQWTDWFGGMTITLEANGDTLLTGQIADQAALHGLLKKVRDLGMPLVSVGQVGFPETHGSHSNKGEAMQSISRTTETQDRKMMLSALWIFATLNYIYADVFNLYFLPGAQQETASMSAGAVLGFAILMETAIAMVLLSRVLKYAANRWANIIAAAINTAAVALTLFASPPAPYYAFYAAIEILCTLGIIAYAWTWRNPEVQQG